MPQVQTTGHAIASNLHRCQIICERDIKRVAKQIDTRNAPIISALEHAEEFLTNVRNARCVLVAPVTALDLMLNIRSTRLALFALSTGADHSLLTYNADTMAAQLVALKKKGVVW